MRDKAREFIFSAHNGQQHQLAAHKQYELASLEFVDQTTSPTTTQYEQFAGRKANGWLAKRTGEVGARR